MSSNSSTPESPLAPKRGRRKEARPGELLDAALDLFVEKGFAATRVEEVAARAGVSKGTLFLYFASKDELFKEVVRRNIADRFVEWDVELAAYQDNTSELLRYCFATWWEHVGATKAGALDKLMHSEANNFPELALFYRQEVVEPGRDLVRRILQRGMERGEFRRMDLDYAAYLVEAPLAFLMMWKHSFGLCVPEHDRFSPEEYIRIQVDNILLGLTTRPA